MLGWLKSLLDFVFMLKLRRPFFYSVSKDSLHFRISLYAFLKLVQKGSQLDLFLKTDGHCFWEI